jgi:CRISPR/Cas system-associated exonuclease Cas4 (RecB family)
MARQRRKFANRVSVSALGTAYQCLAKWWFTYRSTWPKKTTYALLAGKEIHQHVRQLYKQPKIGSPERPFYFKSKESALGAWTGRWFRALHTNRNKIILPNEQRVWQYKAIGDKCLGKYWDDNVNLARPLQLETIFKCKFTNGVELIGVVDQLRTVSIEWIKNHRPALLQGNSLRSGFDPVVIVDLKTGRYDYSVDESEAPASLDMQFRRQLKLHGDLQATAYTYLYKMRAGREPIGFLWYHMRTGNCFFTYRTDQDFKNLFVNIDRLLDSIHNQSFPKNRSEHCFDCSHVEPCFSGKDFMISQAEEIGSLAGAAPQIIEDTIKTVTGQQLRLNLGLGRRKRTQPQEELEPPEPRLELVNVPWQEEDIMTQYTRK